SGGYQFMRKTLQDLSRELRLNGRQIFDPDLQDRLCYHLLKRRGYEEFMAGTISMTEFAKRLAMEWASFPVLAATKGQHQQLKRGQSYYDGDALNKALV
ncbi:glycoside hydrolase family 104 protein, partial [Ochrobactrum sp. GRS2]|nr:glycoside hydrolase family 104 protein [Ochrobactrum sp. GRS2]